MNIRGLVARLKSEAVEEEEQASIQSEVNNTNGAHYFQGRADAFYRVVGLLKEAEKRARKAKRGKALVAA